MPELGLTHSPDQQHENGDSAGNADLVSYGVGTVWPAQNSPLSSTPRGPCWEDSQAEEGIVQGDRFSVSHPVNTMNSPILKSLQEPEPKAPSDHGARKSIFNSDKLVTKVLASTLDLTLPKPHCRYPSSSKTPPGSHDVSRSSPSYSSAKQNGSRNQGGELPCEPSSDGFIQRGANRHPRNGAEALLTRPMEPGESESTSRGQDGSLCRGEKQVTECNDREKYAGDAEKLLPLQRSEKLPSDAEESEPEHLSKEPIHTASVDHPPSAQEPDDQTKARAPYPPGTAIHQPKHQHNTIPSPEDRGIHTAENECLHTTTREPTHSRAQEKVVRTVASSSRHKSPYLPSSTLVNPLLLSQTLHPHTEYSGFWYFYLPSTPTLHGRHRHSHNNTATAHIQHPTMNTQYYYNDQEAAMNSNYYRRNMSNNQDGTMNSYYYPQNMSNNQTQAYAAMNNNTSAYPVPALNTSFYPQQYYSNSSGYPAMPTFGSQAPASTPNSYAQYLNNAAPQYSIVQPSAYQMPAMHQSVVSQNYNTQYFGYSGVPNFNTQIPGQHTSSGTQNPGSYHMMQTNTMAPATTSGSINPALLSFHGQCSQTAPPPPPPPPPTQASKPAATVDLTLDDEVKNPGPEKAAEPKSTNSPATTTNTVTTAAAPIASEEQVLQEATHSPSSTSNTSTTPPQQPQTTTKAAATKPTTRQPRAYTWLVSGTLLPDIPNAKRLKLSAGEVNLRQQYETRAANSTVNYFLGLKPVAPTAAAAAGMPAMDWEKEVAALSASSAKSGKDSPTNKKARPEKRKDVGVRKKDTGKGAKSKASKSKREELKGKLKNRKNAWKKGEEVEEAVEKGTEGVEEEGSEAENDRLAAEIEARYDEEGNEDSEAENDRLAAEIEARYDGEEDGSGKDADADADEQENADLVAMIEAAYEGDADKEPGSQTVTDAELEAAGANPHLMPVEEEQEEEWGELFIDENPLAPGEMPKS